MRIGAKHSHLNGLEWLLVHEKGVWEEIEGAIAGIDAERLDKKITRDKRILGQEKYSPPALNAAFKEAFSGRGGWMEQRTSYWVTDDYHLINRTLHLSEHEQRTTIEAARRRAIKSYNQTDFVKKRVAVEVQFGKYSFIAYDMFVKHLAFFIGNQIEVGVEIVPMKEMQEQMCSGPGYYEGALYDLARQGRASPPVPLVLVGILP